MKQVLIALAIMTSTTGPVYADRDESPEYVELTQVIAAGTGCPATDNGDAVLYADSFLILNLDRMTASAGDGADLRDGRKACQFLLELDYPAGWTFRVESVQTLARARVDEGTSATTVFTSYFQGDEVEARAETVFEGPLRGREEINEELLGEYAPCDADATRALNIKSEVRAHANRRGDDSARITLEGPVAVLLSWKRCE